jgi:hypothetical protein
VFVDQTVVEVYFMDGRVAMTMPSVGGADGSIALQSDVATTASATVWKMGSIWVTPEQVLATPRPDVGITY